VEKRRKRLEEKAVGNAGGFNQKWGTKAKNRLSSFKELPLRRVTTDAQTKKPQKEEKKPLEASSTKKSPARSDKTKKNHEWVKQSTPQ